MLPGETRPGSAKNSLARPRKQPRTSKTPRKAKRRSHPREPPLLLSPVSPVNLSSSLSEVPRNRGSAGELYTGGGFQCRLFDEPYTGRHRAFSPLCDTARGRTWQLNLSHMEDRRPHGSTHPPSVGSSSQINNPSLSPMLPTMSHASPNIQNIDEYHGLLANTHSGGEQPCNTRRGSSVVCGSMSGNGTTCAVRVLLVDIEMLNSLKDVATQLLPASRPNWTGRSGATTPDSITSKRSGLLSIDTTWKDPSFLLTTDDKGDALLSTPFFVRLQQELEQRLQPSLWNESTDGAGEATREDKNIWLCSPSCFLHGQLRKSVEDLISPEASTRRSNGKGEHDSVMITSPLRSINSTLVSDMRTGGNPSLTYHTVNISDDVIPLDTVLMNNTMNEGSEKNKSDLDNKSSGTINCELPITGIAVFPLNDTGTATGLAATVSPLLRGGQGDATAATESIATTTTATFTPLRKGKDKMPSQLVSFSDSMLSERDSTAHRGNSLRFSFGCRAAKYPVKIGETMAATSDVKKKGQKGWGSGGAVHRYMDDPLVDPNISKESGGGGLGSTPTTSFHGTKTKPLFAIALSLPFVWQGNVRDVFLDWVHTHEPSHVLRETVIRNIIWSVLRHLREIHRQGKAHGSVKATNIFIAAHVTEAMTALASKHAAPAAATTKTLGGSPLLEQDLDCAGSSNGGDRGGHTASMDQPGPLEWSKNVVLSDSYYACVEETLITALTGSSGRSAPTPGVHSPGVGPAPPLCLYDVATPNDALEVDALHAFTIDELEYVPPPESITSEGNSGSEDGVYGTQGKDPSTASLKEEGGSPILPFRKTDNTRSPRCLLAPPYDIWMVGMLAIQLADGGSPWWMKRHHRPLPRLRHGPWSIKFASFVQKCACADPARRPSVEELLKDKWFHTALMEDRGGGSASLARPSYSVRQPQQQQQQQQQQQHGGNVRPPVRLPCRRAFLDILLEYHEYAEEWSARLSQAAAEAMLRRGSSFFSFKNRKDSFSTTLSGRGPPELTMTTRKEPDLERLLSSSRSSRSSRSESCRHASSSSGNMSEASSQERARSPNHDAGGAKKVGNDRHSVAPRRISPFFLGAMSLTLEMCGTEASVDAASVDTEPYRDSTSHGGGAPSSQHPRLQLPGSAEEAYAVREEHQELMGELLQAFWNMHRECRLAADVWCVSLLRHMRLDGRTMELVLPLVTEETMSFFAASDADKHPSSIGGKNSWANVSPTITASQQEANNAAALGEQTPTRVDASPTAFHNYMLCKWCVTTSWAMQQA